MSLRRLLFDDVDDFSPLGDIVCTNAEVRAAEDAVATMKSVFASLGSPARWASTVQSISDEWDHYNTPVADLWRDFWLCTRKSIGQQAQSVTRAMQQEAGVAPIPDNPQLSGTALQEVAAVIGGAAAVYAAAEIFRAVRSR